MMMVMVMIVRRTVTMTWWSQMTSTTIEFNVDVVVIGVTFGVRVGVVGGGGGGSRVGKEAFEVEVAIASS
jgi:hypothetical protein